MEGRKYQTLNYMRNCESKFRENNQKYVGYLPILKGFYILN